MPSLVSGDTIEYVAIGTLLYNVKKTDGTWGSKNLAVVYDVQRYGVGAKMNDLEISFITRDGVKKSLILNKYNNYEVAVANATSGSETWNLGSASLAGLNLTAVQGELKGKLMTYREDGNEVSLMPVSAAQKAGYDDPYTLRNTYDTSTSAYDKTNHKIDGTDVKGNNVTLNIADNAVIFLTTTNDAKVVSGKELKTSNTVTYTTIANSFALGGTENGVKYVQAAAIGVNTMPTVTGTNYAYVLNAAETTDDQDYRYIELWTANGKLEAYEASSDLYTYDGGEIVTYTVVSTADGRTVIKNVEEVVAANLKIGRITSDGFYGSGESKIAIGGAAYDLTSDAIVLNVDTDKKEGINSENPKSGAREGRQNENNILYVTNGKGEIVFALVDGNNNKVLCENITLGSGDDINVAFGSANNVTTPVTTISSTSPVTVPAGKTLTLTETVGDVSGLKGTGNVVVSGSISGAYTELVPAPVVADPSKEVALPETLKLSGAGDLDTYWDGKPLNDIAGSTGSSTVSFKSVSFTNAQAPVSATVKGERFYNGEWNAMDGVMGDGSYAVSGNEGLTVNLLLGNKVEKVRFTITSGGNAVTYTFTNAK